jgi:hypothetical protein
MYVHNSQWILVSKKWITAQISQLAGLSIAGHIITQSAETRTNMGWPVIWWFTRQWVMWHYLTCASSLLFLHHLPKINRGYFQNSPCIKILNATFILVTYMSIPLYATFQLYTVINMYTPIVITVSLCILFVHVWMWCQILNNMLCV